MRDVPNKKRRDVAQLGSAPCSGRGGRKFESCHPDHFLGKDILLKNIGTWQGLRRNDWLSFRMEVVESERERCETYKRYLPSCAKMKIE